jgi:hypothetical protein
VAVTVTPAAKRPSWVQNLWDLADLLGRPLGCIIEDRDRQLYIDLNQRGRALMPKGNLGPHASLDEALTEIEKHTHGVCRRAAEER